MKTLPTIAFLAVALTTIGGCSLLSRPAADQAQYYLEAPAPAAAAGDAKILPLLAIRRASALAPFDGLAFVYAQVDGTWRTDAYAGWIATPGAMVTSALSDYLSRSGRFGLVSAQGDLRSNQAELSVVVERLYGDFRAEGQGKAVVRLRWYLTMADADTSSDRLLGSGVVETEAPVAANDAGAVAEAFSAALGSAFERVLAGIAEGVAAAAPKTGG